MVVVAGAGAANTARRNKHNAGTGELSAAEQENTKVFDDAPDQELRSIVLEKSSLNSQGKLGWSARLSVLTESFLVFYEPDDPAAEIDRIPLIEIAKVTSKF
ncbi:MAG: hypothetical protein ACPIOQ_71560, partial [Promethearchaeia archaeon]